MCYLMFESEVVTPYILDGGVPIVFMVYDIKKKKNLD